MAVNLPAGVKEVDRIPAPGGGYYVVGSDGGVFAVSDEQGRTPAAFYGSVPMIKGDTLAGQHQFGPGAIKLLPDGGYILTDTTGHQYGFNKDVARGLGLQVPDTVPGALPAKNIYSDPAFLAFLRNSGLDMDTAAADVARQESALQAGLQNRVADLQLQGEQARRGIDNNFESRGVFRSGQRGERLGEQDALTNTGIAGAQSETADKVAGLKSYLAGKVAEQAQKAGDLGLSIDAADYQNQQGNILKGIQDRADTAYNEAKRKLSDYGVMG